MSAVFRTLSAAKHHPSINVRKARPRLARETRSFRLRARFAPASLQAGTNWQRGWGKNTYNCGWWGVSIEEKGITFFSFFLSFFFFFFCSGKKRLEEREEKTIIELLRS